MSDIQKTEFLRRKIQQLKEDTSIGSEKPEESEDPNARSGLYYLVLFTLRYFAFFGSQHYILEKTSYGSFGLWESFLIYITLLSFISIFKKS